MTVESVVEVSLWALVIGYGIGGARVRRAAEQQCADAHLGVTNPEWWRKAVALAEFRKSEKERGTKL